MKVRLALASTSAVFALGVFAGPAAADSLTVTTPCGCQPLHAGQYGFDSGYSQPVGVPSNSPAESNPSGSVGNADNSNGVGLTGRGNWQLGSGSASFG